MTVILSEAKDLLSFRSPGQQLLRFAQDDSSYFCCSSQGPPQILASRNRFTAFLGGIAVNVLGHAHPSVVAHRLRP
jgi:acetylornithine/succinyldiaminopimelate/putrescine aminotransferase